MRFPKKFVRYIGAGLSPLLGSDADPTTLTPEQQKAYRARENVLTTRVTNVNGFPAQRLAVGIHYTGAGAPAVAPLAVFVWDDNSERWYKLVHGTAPTIPSKSIIFADTIALLDFPNTHPGEGMQPTGALELALVVSAPAAAPDGTYTIVAGCDVSNPGV